MIGGLPMSSDSMDDCRQKTIISFPSVYPRRFISSTIFRPPAISRILIAARKIPPQREVSMISGRKYAALVGCLFASIASTPALAQDWYVSGAATLTILSDPDSVIQNAPTPGSTLYITNVLDDTGWGGQVAAGHRFGPVRIEAEVGRTRTVAKRYVVTSPISNDLPQTGADTVTRFMANAYVDVPIHGIGIRPYLGAGIGDAIVHVTTKASKPFGPPTAPMQLIDDRPNGFAWQAMAGVAVPLSPRFAVTAQYRYFDAGTLNGNDTRGQDFQTRIRGSNVDLGVRFSF